MRGSLASCLPDLDSMCQDVSMQEFLYISDRQLSQFMPDPPPWWKRGIARGEARVPFVTLNLEQRQENADEARMRKLQEVIRHIEQTATWYEDEEAFVGEWVFLKLAFATVDLMSSSTQAAIDFQVHFLTRT